MGESQPNAVNSAITDRKRGVRFTKSEFTPAQKLNGVMLYLYDKGHTDPKSAHAIIKRYEAYKTPESKREVQDIAIDIQADFPSFVKWYKVNEK